MSLELIKKYNVKGPRYTSYPTAAQFREGEEEEFAEMETWLDRRNRQPREISLYFHIPFCFSLCWYCACTKIITRDRDRGEAYLDYLEREMDRVAARLHPASEVVQIHFGGGTPTFLKPSQLIRLGEALHGRFRIAGDVEFSVEIDPRECTPTHVHALSAIGCNRASLGVQDTNREVQEAVHRFQSFEQVEQLYGWLRREGIRSLNFDLIYGLPRQTLEAFRRTLDDVLGLQPDRLAVYSYAHLPEMMPAQRLLDEKEMPSADEKLAMMQLGIAVLRERGYRYIGMDHFAREGDELVRALERGDLQRNFQGYSTRGEADLYGLGMSGISQVDEYYWQNEKDLARYYAALDESKPPTRKLLKLEDDDRLRRDVIMRVMCRKALDFDDLGRKWDLDFAGYFEEELECLEEMEEDGLLKLEPERLIITETGRLFLRNIAMCFDRYLDSADAGSKFSKTI